MKVILNVDVKSLGEEGDVKNVANGYARNFLLPRNLAVPYNEATVAIFEGRKAEIEARKEQKRKDSASLKEKLEASAIELTMPAAANGKLYAAVTANVVAEALAKLGFEIERKRIEIPGSTIKSVGNFKATIKLYEAQVAEVHVAVKAQPVEGAAPAEAKKAELRAKMEEANKAVKDSVRQGAANFRSDMEFTQASIDEIFDDAEKRIDARIEEGIENIEAADARIEERRDERREAASAKLKDLQNRINDLSQLYAKTDQEELILDLLSYADECQANAVYMAEQAVIAYKAAADQMEGYYEKYGDK